MTTEEKEKFNEEQSSNSDLEKENKSSFFGRLKSQVSNLKTKVEKLAFEEFEQGIVHPSTTSRIIHDGDEFIVLTDGYFMRMVVEHEEDADLKVYKVVRQCLLEPTMKTYQECYKIGQWLNSKQNKISGDER